MNQEWVKVCAVQDDGIWVESQRHSAATAAMHAQAAASVAFAKLGKTVRLWLPLENARTYQVGQSLQLELPVGGLALSALMLYGFAITDAYFAVLLAQTLASDWQVMLAGMAGLAIGMLLSRF